MRQAGCGKPEAGRQSIVGAAASERDRDDPEKGRDGKPVGYRPEQGRNEVAVTVHITVGVGRSVVIEVESVFPPEVIKNRHHHDHADGDGVADELVVDHSLDEKREQSEGHELRKYDDIQFLEILAKFVVVITGNCLHNYAAEHGDREQEQFNEGNCRQLGQPVDALAHGQRVVDAVYVRITLAPDEFSSIEPGDDKKEKSGAPFDGLQHEVGHGPDVNVGDTTCEVAIIDGEYDHESANRPERNLVQDESDAQTGEG